MPTRLRARASSRASMERVSAVSSAPGR
jgi:hypothetical protein